ncbi:MAG: lipoyl synthase [Bacteroidales bacterium]|nr:lipoyl synthase [Bacteroidales bacterium]MDZ4204256.1 lipoyl synthase [Bacteroidales bacterium]
MPKPNNNYKRKPSWLKIKLPSGANYRKVKQIVEGYGLHTICSSGNCPNLGECWGAGTATFMILGEICTRSCRFCATQTGKPLPVDYDEPRRLAHSVKLMKLKHCVITSVDRDDLEDGGAGVWAETIRAIRDENLATTIEVLVPDFKGRQDHLQLVLSQKPDICAHNLETVRRLTPLVRSAANYDRSLQVIRWITEKGLTAKSGIMVGLGETFDEVMETMDDLLAAGCTVMTIGQYLQPSLQHLRVEEYIHPDVFTAYRNQGLIKGFRIVESNPLVRSSYHAEKHV